MSYLEMAKLWKASRLSPVERNSTLNYELNEINEISPNDTPEYVSEAAKVTGQLEQTGIARIHSGVLKEDICFANNDIDATRVKKLAPGAIVYTLDELRELVRDGMTTEGLKQIHAAKKIFNGMVVKNDKNPFTR